MCELCDKIYTEDILRTDQDDRCFEGDFYIKKINFNSSKNTYYYLCKIDGYENKDEELMQIKYCPECGKQLFYDAYYHGTILNNPKIKIIKIGE